jgi:hypothetical protein
MATGYTVGIHIRRDVVDRLIELYCDWRTVCAEVQASYERFLDASACERDMAFAAYCAALDREQSTSEAYARQVRLVESRCGAADERTRRPETRRA